MRTRLAVPLTLAAALAGSAPLPAQEPATIAVEGMRLQASDRPSCLLVGEWPDGSPLQYLAWDACAQLSVRRVGAEAVRGAASLGIDDHVTVADIPPGAPILEIANDYSVVILFPDRDGVTQEILIGD
jgi:hypothetical protein